MTANGSGLATAATVVKARDVDQLSSKITSEHNAPANAVKFHPLADMFPLMEGEEFDQLVADIKANGLHEQIVLYDGMILDGRNRYRACLALGWTWAAIDNMSINLDSLIHDYGGPAAYVISANIHRRHLTREQTRELIAKLIKAQPEKSDRAIAADMKVDKNVVSRVRKEAESTGAVAPVEKRVGKDGKARKQPASKVTEKHRLPSPKKANEQAKETGKPTLASDGYIYFGTSEENAKAGEDQRAMVYGVRRALDHLANINLTGTEFLKYASPWQLWKPEEAKVIKRALKWLTSLDAAWDKWEARE
jgi:ParB-like chromosome segregation protein Spo0J